MRLVNRSLPASTRTCSPVPPHLLYNDEVPADLYRRASCPASFGGERRWGRCCGCLLVQSLRRGRRWSLGNVYVAMPSPFGLHLLAESSVGIQRLEPVMKV